MRIRLLAAAFLALQFGLHVVAQTIESGPKTYPAGTTIAPASGSVTTLTTSGDVTVPSGADVTYRATEQIRLEPGFSVLSGGVFRTQFVTGTAPTITSANTATFAIGQADQFTVQATGTVPMTYGYSGTLPSWATLNTATGVLSGTPPNTTGSPFTFVVTATNSAGTATQNFTLVAATPPSITTQPGNQTAYVGESVTLNVTASGTGPLTYQWKRSGTAITGATNATLTLTNLQTANAGAYTVAVTGPGGTTTSTTATLTVPDPIDGITWNFFEAPEHLRQGQQQVIRANVTNSGTTVWTPNYSMVASGSGGPTLWAPIPANVRPGLSVDVMFTLTAPSADTNWTYTFAISGPSGGFGDQPTKSMQVANWVTSFYPVTSPTTVTCVAGSVLTYETTMASSPSWYLANWGAQPVSYSQFNPRTGKLVVIPFSAGQWLFNVGAGYGPNWPDLDFGREMVTLIVSNSSTTTAPGPFTVPGVVNVDLGWFSTNLTTQPASYATAGQLPPGITFDPAWRRFSGTPTQGGTYTVTVTATTATGTIAVPVTFGIAATVDAPTAPGPLTATSVASSSLTLNWGASTTSVGIERYIIMVDGSTTVQSIGAQTSVSLSYAAGSTHTFRVQAKDVAGNYSPWSNDLTVQLQSATPTITSQPQNQTVALGAAAQFSVSASGSGLSYQWRKNGSAINGATLATLSFSSAQANDAGAYSVVVSNSAGSVTSQSADLVVISPPVITSATSASGTLGIAFSYQITATNSPTSYNATNLPAGLSVNTSTGVISGTPTSTGTTSIAISATNAGGTGNATLLLTIDSTPPPPPTITSATTASGVVGTAFSYQITATNTPTSYSASGLPAGLSINTSTGAITGTPTTSGSYTVTLGATNAGGTGNATLALTLSAAPQPPPVINSPTSATGYVGATFTYQITATNDATSYGASGLPGGLSINVGTGLITGTPTTAGTSSVTISATNVSGTGSATLTITIGTGVQNDTTNQNLLNIHLPR